MPSSSDRSAIVVGAGIAGLTAAYRLQQRGFQVRVLEAEAIAGGRMSCKRIDGFTLNRAATLLAGKYEFLIALIKELGLSSSISYRDFKIGTLRNGKLYGLRTNHLMLDSLFSGLLGWRSKWLMLRALRDAEKARPFMDYADLSRAAHLDVESAEAYGLRRLNREISEYVIDPSVAAFLATTGARISVVDFLFIVAQYIGLGAYRVEGGIDFLVQALTRRLPVQTNARVLSVIEQGDQVEVRWEQGGVEKTETCSAAVVAVSGPLVPQLCPQLDARQRRLLQGYEYSNILVGHFGLSSPTDTDIDFLQVPPRESAGLINMLFAERVGGGMVPPGKGLLVAYFNDGWSKARMDWSDERIIADMIPLIEPIVPELRHKIVLRNVERWSPALYMSKPGSYQRMAEFQATIDPRSRIQLAGDYFSFTSTNASAMSGDIAARRIADHH